MLLFVFEDIVKLDDRSIQLVLKEVDPKDLALALRGVSDETSRSRSSPTCPQRGAEMLLEEIEFQPPQRRRVVEEAQGRIVASIRRLEEAGEIIIGRGGGEEDQMALMQTFVLDQLEPATDVPDVGDLARRRRVARAPRPTRSARPPAPRASPPARRRAPRPRRRWPRRRSSPAVQALHAAAEALAAERGALADQVEARAVELALELAEKVVAGAIAAQPERVLDVVRGALRCLVERERVIVLVNPEDLDLVRGAIDDLAAELGGIEHVEVQEERRVGRGGAIVRTTASEVDASIRHEARARPRGPRGRAPGVRVRPDRGSTVQGVLDPARESARGVLDIAGDALGRPTCTARHGRVSRPDRPDHRGHRPRGRGRRALHDRDRAPPPGRPRRGRRLPRRPHAAHAARRDERDRPRPHRHRDRRGRCASPSATSCSAA